MSSHVHISRSTKRAFKMFRDDRNRIRRVMNILPVFERHYLRYPSSMTDEIVMNKNLLDTMKLVKFPSYDKHTEESLKNAMWDCKYIVDHSLPEWLLKQFTDQHGTHVFIPHENPFFGMFIQENTYCTRKKNLPNQVYIDLTEDAYEQSIQNIASIYTDDIPRQEISRVAVTDVHYAFPFLNAHYSAISREQQTLNLGYRIQPAFVDAALVDQVNERVRTLRAAVAQTFNAQTPPSPAPARLPKAANDRH